jgi:AraC-like DNA-binding protein
MSEASAKCETGVTASHYIRWASAASPPRTSLCKSSARAAPCLAPERLLGPPLGRPRGPFNPSVDVVAADWRNCDTLRGAADRRALTGTRPRARLRAVADYVEEHLDASSTLERMAVARLSPNYFASQFQRATGLPSHRYVIARRVEHANQLLMARRLRVIPGGPATCLPRSASKTPDPSLCMETGYESMAAPSGEGWPPCRARHLDP